MNLLVAMLCGVSVVAGLLLILRGARRSVPPPIRHSPSASLFQRWEQITHRPLGARGRRRDIGLAVSVVLGFVVMAFTGWVLAVAIVPLLLIGLPALLAEPDNADIHLLEALDRWVRSMIATIPTGQSVLQAVRTTQRNAPESLAPHLSVLISRLDARWTTREAMLGLADDLHSPDSDAVVAALFLAAERGGTGATTTLTALSDSIQSRLKALREIEAERSKPRIVVRQITIITVLMLLASFAFGREFFAPYATPIGQLILGALLAVYVSSLLMLRRMTTPVKRARILTGGAS